MNTYNITDQKTGKTITIKGDKDPTPQDIDEIFSQVNSKPSSQQEQKSFNPISYLIQKGKNAMLKTGEMSEQIVKHPMQTAKEAYKNVMMPQSGVLAQGLRGGAETATFLPDLALKAMDKKPIIERLKEYGIVTKEEPKTATEQTAKLFGEFATPLTPGGVGGKVLGGALKPLGNFTKEAIKEGIAAGSKVRNYAVRYAMKNPEVLTKEVPDIIAVGDNINNKLYQLKNLASEEYAQSLSKLAVPKGNVIDTNKVSKYIAEKNLDPKILSSILENIRTKTAQNIDPTLYDRLLTGQPIALEEAKQLNRLLVDASDQANKEVVSKGLLDNLSNIKSLILNSIEDKVPGTKVMNKEFAKKIKFIEALDKDIFKSTKDGKELKEGVLKSTGEQLAGVRRTREILSRKLDRLDRLTGGEKITKQLPDALVAEEFSKQPMGNLMSTIRLGAGAGVGGAVGGLPGAIAGPLLAEYASRPQTTKSLILASKSDVLKKLRNLKLGSRSAKIIKPVLIENNN